MVVRCVIAVSVIGCGVMGRTVQVFVHAGVRGGAGFDG